MQNRNRKNNRRDALALFYFPENTVTRHLTNKLDVVTHCHDALRVTLLDFPAIVLPRMRRRPPSAADALISLGRDSSGSNPLCPQGRT